MRFKCVKEFPDGSAKFDVTLSQKDEKLYRQIAKIRKQNYTKRFVKEMIMEALTNVTKGEANV